MQTPADSDRDLEASAEAWPPRAQAIAAVLWPSFLAAGIATTLFFASIDPIDLGAVLSMPMELTRMQGYGLGFLLFWLLCALSSTMSVFLLRTARPEEPPESD